MSARWAFLADVFHRRGWRPDVRNIVGLYRMIRQGEGVDRMEALRQACAWDHHAWAWTMVPEDCA